MSELERSAEKVAGPWHHRAALHWIVCPIRRRWMRRRWHMPFWADDKTAQMLGVAQYGCRRCGRGAIEQRDAATCPCGHGEHLHDREASPPLCMVCGDDLGCVTPPEGSES